MLGSFEIQLEHDPLRTFCEFATLATQDRAEAAGIRPIAHHHPVAQALQKGSIDRFFSSRDVEEDVFL
jgi:hypothetical protein